MAVENINDIVSEQAIEQLFNLGRQLESAKAKMTDLIEKADKLKNSLNQTSTFRETASGVKDLNDATEKINKTNSERLDLERKIKEDGAKMAQQVKEETNNFEKLAEIMEKYAKTQGQTALEIVRLKSALEGNKNAIKNLSENYKAGRISIDEYKKEQADLIIKKTELKKALSDEQKTLKQVSNDLKSADGSQRQMAARLSQLKDLWKGLSQSERENVNVGGVLKTEINNLDEALKGMEKSIGENQRSVGNYQTAITSLTGKMPMGNNMFVRMAVSAQKAGVSLGTYMVGGLKAVGIAMTSLLLHPLILAIAGITLLIMGIVNAIKKNEDQLNRLTKAFAPLQVVLNLVFKILSIVADKLIDIIESLAKVTGGVMKWAEKLPFVGKYMKEINNEMSEQVRLEERRQALAKKTREDMVKVADIELDVAKLRDKVAQKDKYTQKERIGFLKEAIKKEQEILKIKHQQLVEEHNILAAEINARGGLKKASKEQLDEYYSLKASIKNSGKEFFNSTRRMQRELSALRQGDLKGQDSDEKEIAEKKKSYLQDIFRIERENANKREKLNMDIAESERKKKDELLQYPQLKAEITKKYDLEIQALKQKLAQEAKNIELKLNEDILKSIETLNNQRVKLGVASEQEMTEKLIEVYEQRQKYLLEKLEIEKNEELRQYKENSEEYLKIVDLYANRELEIKNNTEISKREIRKKGFDAIIRELKEQLKHEEALAILEKGRTLSQNEVAELKLNAIKEELELWDLKKDKLEELGISEEEYVRKVAELKAQLITEEEAVKKSIEATENARKQEAVTAISSLIALGDVMADQIEDEKEQVRIKQSVAMAQVLLNEGIAISMAIIKAFEGDTYTAIPRLIASIAAIASGMIPAISAIQKAKAYAQGTDHHVGGGAVIGEGRESELVETPDGQRFIVDRPLYFDNLPIGTSVTPFSQISETSTTDMQETNELLRKLTNKPIATIDVSDRVTAYLVTKMGRNKILNQKFKF